MIKQFRRAGMAMAFGLAGLALSACTMNDMAGLAASLSGPGPYAGASSYPVQPAYGAAPATAYYYPVIVQAPAPAYVGPAPAYGRNPYAVSNRYGDHRRSGARRDRSWH